MRLAALVARHWPFANGSGRILDLFARGLDLGSGERLARTNDGISLHVLADDLIGRHILLSGQFDRSIVQVLIDQARPGDVLLDVGANIGYVSACFLSQVPDSRSICIEPQPGITDILSKNLAAFGERATIHMVALSDKNGELRFHIDNANRGASKIAGDGEFSVPAVDARQLLGTLDRVDLVKIDVEGHEPVVFKAMEGELGRLRPRAILFEDQVRAAAPDAAIGSILARLGYQVMAIRKRLLSTDLIPVVSGADCIHNDYLAIRKD